MSRPPVAVLRFPGTNCECETARAVEGAGGGAVIVRWNEDLSALRRYAAFVLPGGFAYQDRVRAGAIAAKDEMMDVIAEQAALGKPVLGICNGAQILVEAGLVPGLSRGMVEMALAPNVMDGRAGYYSRWCYLRVNTNPAGSPFTWSLDPGEVLAVPVAHGEGRFTTGSPSVEQELLALGLIPFVYARADGGPAGGFPENPNGSLHDAAGVMNPEGNVLALMPHPERACGWWQVSPRAARARFSPGAEVTAALEAHGGPGGRIFGSMIGWLRHA
jgi:phosphoribosylformylglycinamidine synthase